MTSSPDWEAYHVLGFIQGDFASQHGEVMNSLTWIWVKAANSMAKGTFCRWNFLRGVALPPDVVMYRGVALPDLRRCDAEGLVTGNK